MVERFSRKRVVRIELGEGAFPVAGQRAAAMRSDGSAGPDFEQMLREAYELIDDGDLTAARRALQRVVQGAPDDVLKLLDTHSRTQRGASLADLVAQTRMQAALARGGTTPLDLKTPTRYESAALGQRLEQLYTRILAAQYDGRTLEAWAAEWDSYDTLRPDARRLAVDARLAAAAIGARVRYDPALADDPDARRALAALHSDLVQLIAHVRALPGFTSFGRDELDSDDPTLRAAQRLAQQALTTQPAADAESDTN